MQRKENTLGESLEDYAEAILELEKLNGVARVTDLAEKLSVSKPSVTEALNVLKEKEIIVYSPYKPIRLTAKGKNLAKKIKQRHDILTDFLTNILCVEPKKAESQACRMEHILEPEVIQKFCDLAKTLGNSGSFQKAHTNNHFHKLKKNNKERENG
ncbi:MAG: metal-dependent transcriptional regulator [Acidobacteriota bacterium]|nr:metal-dependent transcriptional regulator [Thermoanaerobaculaceae bacterium]